MTLLEWFTANPSEQGLRANFYEEVRRALAIAQAAEEWVKDGDVTAQFILRRADELLAGKEK